MNNKIFYNHHFISTDCNYTIPLQPNQHSHRYLTATPKITFTFQKHSFCNFHTKFCEKSVSLIKKIQPFSYQQTSNITPRLPLCTSQPTHKIYNATALLHIPTIHEKLHIRLEQQRPNIRSHSVLFHSYKTILCLVSSFIRLSRLLPCTEQSITQMNSAN